MILGVSFDPPAENRAFREAQDFPFRLLSDQDRTVARAYGALRDPDDPHPHVPRRISHLIDPVGVIAASYEVTDVDTHPDEVLRDLTRLHGD